MMYNQLNMFAPNVLSLFNGMSCARMALDLAGVEYYKYFSSEIDKFANKLTKFLYPDTIQLYCSKDTEKVKNANAHAFYGEGRRIQTDSPLHKVHRQKSLSPVHQRPVEDDQGE